MSDYNWKNILKIGTWNAYIRDYDGGGYMNILQSIADPSYEEEAEAIETDSQDETYKRFKMIMAVVGMTVQGDKNEGVTRNLIRGFLQQGGSNANYWYVISQVKPADDYKPDFNPHSSESVRDLTEE